MHLKNLRRGTRLSAFMLMVALFAVFAEVKAQTTPIAINDTIRLCEGTTVVIDLLANDIDPDPDPLETDILAGPASVLIDYDDEALPEGSYAITIDPGFSGTDFLIYEVCGDEDDLCATGILVILVTGEAGCVWPGDANGDSICNYIDLLPIGLYYGLSGPDREDEDGDWDETYCDEWDDVAGIDFPFSPKFSDLNGNGTINAEDTIIIKENYGLLRGVYTPTAIIGGPDDPFLGIDLLSDTITAGSTVVVPINFGTELSPANNIYGASFQIAYDKTIIKAASVKATFNSGWLGTVGEDLIYLQENDTTNGILYVSVTRINQASRTGYNHFAELGFVMEDNIAGKMNGEITSSMVFCVELPQVINNAGVAIPVQTVCDSAVAIQFTNSIHQAALNTITTIPNPANNNVTITLATPIEGTCTIINGIGQIITSQHIIGSSCSIETSMMPAGNYIIQIKTANEILHTQLIIQH